MRSISGAGILSTRTGGSHSIVKAIELICATVGYSYSYRMQHNPSTLPAPADDDIEEPEPCDCDGWAVTYDHREVPCECAKGQAGRWAREDHEADERDGWFV